MLLAVVAEQGGSVDVKAEALRGLLHLSFAEQGRLAIVQMGGMKVAAAATLGHLGSQECVEAGLMILWQLAASQEGQVSL